MISVKKAGDLKLLREGGKRHAAVIRELLATLRPNMLARELENLARELVSKGGGTPAFLNYQPRGAQRPFPAALCVSINEEIVHGIPNEEDKIIKEGDLVTLDLGFCYKGMITDMAVTVAVGKVDEKSLVLMDATKKALAAGIKAAKCGNRIGDIGAAIEKTIKRVGFEVVSGLAGHGVGYKVHEEPFVPNSGVAGKGEVLRKGMVLAIEPMASMGSPEIRLKKDGYTYCTADNSLSAHFEHTIAITADKPVILTQ